MSRNEPRPAAQPDKPNPELEAELQRLFGFDRFRLGQQRVIENVLSGRSVLAVMPTGAGKSLCYQLPAMIADGVTVVVSPLIALMKDQVDGLPAKVQSQATLINSTLEGDEIDRRLRDIASGRYKLVYAAPERLRQTPFLHALRSRGVSLFVIDETHCVSMWGHDFRPDYLFIGNALGYLGDPTVLAMTATATPKMRREIQDYFGRKLEVVSTGTHRPNLRLESIVTRTQEEKMRELVRICRGASGSGIVYTRSRDKAEELAILLRRHQVRAAYYHAGLEDDERARVQEDFMDDRCRVICATVAFGMGIDKPDVRFVVHFSPPQSLENYYQEAGRAGRDGKPAQCVLLYSPGDRAAVTRWTRQEAISIELPRRVYAYMREITSHSPHAAVHVDDIARDTGCDETAVRVAIGLLERVGLFKRHLDVPATATVGLNRWSEADDEAGQFISEARLKPGQRMPFNTLGLCERTGVSPTEIERKLLEWRDEGLITYHGSGRTMLLERLPAPRDARSALETLVTTYTHAQVERADLMFAYAETRQCRHDFIAEHFGEAAVVEGCESCDNCAGGSRREVATSKQAVPAGPALTNEQKRMKILETVRMVSGQVGFTGLVRVLKGSIQSHIKRDRCPNFGILADDPKTAVERWVSELIEDGHLVRDDGEYRLISLGPKCDEALR